MPFEKGNKLGGRSQGAKNILPKLRQLLTNEAHKRWKIKEGLANISDEKLLDAIIKLMPKDVSIAVKPDIQYISNIPDAIESTNDDDPQSTSDQLAITGDVLALTSDVHAISDKPTAIHDVPAITHDNKNANTKSSDEWHEVNT